MIQNKNFASSKKSKHRVWKELTDDELYKKMCLKEKRLLSQEDIDVRNFEEELKR